ncbi:MAG TPA: protein-glutamate O-methyltransferase CheR [Sulfurimonas autotrophica]|uniref:protein-glutamate O-methyltransferase n=1 Tax=Sulfurimonas autotrophica TaxID=202747 RepID=A0A7C3FX06_9BACT|nr:protein-glutamate O-methyltransferase CheR [Sulfurimonas autotrophica]
MFSFFRKKVQKEVTEPVVVYIENFDDVSAVAEYFHKETGITFEKQMSILKSKVSSFCRQRKIPSFEELLSRIQIDPALKQEFIDYLTTNETFFYRESKQIKELVKLVKQKNSTNTTILCAPCATGEEPYSIAIALLESGVAASCFHIVGIDINADAITKAKKAVYKERNIRNLSAEILHKYFTVENERYTLKESVKSLVSFEVANIFDDSFTRLGKFDFVFSRNMLIYFDKETKQRAKSILESMRKDDIHDVFFGHADLF